MAEPLAPKNYKVARNGVEIGEFKPFAFMQDVQSGKIRQDDWYWVQGMSEWKRVSELKILEELRESPPPPPLSRAQLDGVTRGSIVQVIDPEASVWYWVVVERCFEDRSFLVASMPIALSLVLRCATVDKLLFTKTTFSASGQ